MAADRHCVSELGDRAAVLDGFSFLLPESLVPQEVLA